MVHWGVPLFYRWALYIVHPFALEGLEVVLELLEVVLKVVLEELMEEGHPELPGQVLGRFERGFSWVFTGKHILEEPSEFSL